MRKIGDTVRIREDLQVTEYDGLAANNYMIELAGKSATITSVYHPMPYDTCYKLDIDVYGWSWNDSMLEDVEAQAPAAQEPEIEEPEASDAIIYTAKRPAFKKIMPDSVTFKATIEEPLSMKVLRDISGTVPNPFELTFAAQEPPADDYETAVRSQIEHCWKLLFSKRKEYATADPFHNFKRAADLQGITKEQALIGMMDKHVISVHDMVNEAAEGADFSADKWREKISDNINYLLILWAMVSMEGGAN